ncbi:MAG: hypothetical protein Q9191_001982 [Dirinaria sp. TL-2023a]
MSGQSSGRTLRSSTSPQLSASSVPLSNHPAGLDGNNQAVSTQTQMDQDDTFSYPADQVQAINVAHDNQLEHEHVKKRPRHSGGFLLQSAFPSGSNPLKVKDNLSGNIEGVKNKGKAKADEDELNMQKRRHLRHRHQLKHSVGSSPLANEVMSVTSATGSDHKGTANGGNTASTPSKTSQSVRSSAGSDITSSSVQSDKPTSSSIEGIPALGLNTDPAQIVNLALSLSESRRRNFSGGLLTPGNTHGDKRVISAGSLTAGFSPLSGGGSLRHHLEQQRRISRRISPRSSKGGSRASPSPRPSQDSGNAPTVPDIELAAGPDLSFSPSDATLSRAEKARVAIELGYEYRRLLQYLPKIPLPSESRPKTARSTRKASPESSNDLGRPYNPLQYIRNRKVRLRQGSPLNSESEKWKDVDKVRHWIDTVAGEREAGIATIDDRFPLPSFENAPGQTPIVDGFPGMDNRKQNPAQGSKPRRPRIEWGFRNWDLLADAYWLQHDGNVSLIEDCRGEKVLASPQSYKAPSTRTSADLEPATHSRSDSVNGQAISPEKFRFLMDKARKETSKERNHRENERVESGIPNRQADGHRDRKSRWPRKLMRSHSSSSLSGSDYEESTRHKLGRHRGQDDIDSAILEKHMKKLLEQEMHEKGALVNGRGQDKADGMEFKSDEPDSKQSTNGIVANSSSPAKPPQTSKEFGYSSRSALPWTRTSLEEPRGRRPRTSTDDDLDVTAPNSPVNQGSLPRFAFHHSRARSPSNLLRKALPSRSRSRGASSNDKQAISETDFAPDANSLSGLSKPSTRDSRLEDGPRKEKAATHTDGFLSPTTAEDASRIFRRSDDNAKKGLKESSEHESKFRGFFRNSRITEIVSHEVSRVGDKLWRKDYSNPASRIPSPASSVTEESDTESDILNSSPEITVSQTTVGGNSQDNASLQKPKYHMSNLPTFRSSFAKDEHPPAETLDTIDTNEAPSMPALQRGRQRSSRFEGLAPPKLDMRNISPTPPPPMTRTQTRNTVPSYDPFDSRQSSASRSEGRVREADRRLNAVLGIPGTIGRGGPPITGLAILESRQRRSEDRPTLKDKREWSVDDRSVSASKSLVTKRDIARVRALLLSSGVKANEISRRAHEIPSVPSSMFKDIHGISEGPWPKVPRSEEHNAVARIYAGNIDSASEQLRGAAERFSNDTLENLQKQIKDIDERVTQKLTPSVRACADEADAFSAQLTTTHVLEVKQLNDSVDAILRKRRRRMRWIRRGAYVLLEWTLLGIMWWVWLIVVILRLIRGTIRGFINARNFADERPTGPNTKPSIHDSDTVVLPGSQSTNAVGPTPPPPGPVPPGSPISSSPATPNANTAIPPQSVPLAPPTPPGGKVQTAPPTSIPPATQRDAAPVSPTAPTGNPSTSNDSSHPPPPPPPTPPKRRLSRFRRFVLALILLGGFGYAGGVYYSLVSDNFHDFFTEFIPFGEDAVFYFEEREFRKRFPGLTNPTNRPPSDSGNKITIPSKSGLSWRVADDEHQGSDTGKRGPHMSALDKNPTAKAENAQRTPSAATGREQVEAVQKAKKDANQGAAQKPEPPKEAPKPAAPAPKETAKPVPKAESAPTPAPKPTKTTADAPKKGPEVNEPSVIQPIPPIDPLMIKNADEPLVHDLVKLLNDIITVVNADNASYKYGNPISKAKNELAGVGARILALKQAEKNSGEQKIKTMQAEFDSSAKELVGRLEAEMRDQELRWRDDFASEREKISQSYEERLRTELGRSQEVAEQKHRNELLEQALSLKKDFLSSVRDRVETERSGRLSKLNELSTSVSELESLTADWNSVIDSNLKTQHLQVAIEAVRSALEDADRPRPFVNELAALKELASDDPVVNAAIASINPTAYQRGIPTTAQLIDRFRRVAAEVRKSALLPEDAGIASHAASWALSKMMFQKKGMTTGDDVESVLTRTETLLEEGNLDQAAREMNALDGWAKTLSWDWLGECRRVLEVRQALEVCGAQARLRSLSID